MVRIKKEVIIIELTDKDIEITTIGVKMNPKWEKKQIECLEKHSNVSSSSKFQSKTCMTSFSSNSSCNKAVKYTLQHLRMLGHKKAKKYCEKVLFMLFLLLMDESNCAM